MAPKETPKRQYLIYPPIATEAWDRLTQYRKQAQAHIADPLAPLPDITLLADPEHGPLRNITPGYDDRGSPVLFFEVQNETFKPRHAPPLVMLMLRTVLAFGGGCSVNDNGGGWAYIRLFGGLDRLMLLRLMANAGPGEMVRQCNPLGRRGDFRSQDPEWTTKAPVERAVEAGDKPRRRPRTGREQAIMRALRYHGGASKRLRLPITGTEYGAILREVFALLDAVYRKPA